MAPSWALDARRSSTPLSRKDSLQAEEGRLGGCPTRQPNARLKALWNDLVGLPTTRKWLSRPKKLTARSARQLAEKGLKALGRATRIFSAITRRGPRQLETGEIYRGRRQIPKSSQGRSRGGIQRTPALDIATSMSRLPATRSRSTRTMSRETRCSTSTV